MSDLDPRFAARAAQIEARENDRSPNRVAIIRTPDLPIGSAGSEGTAFHFVLNFPRRGAAVQSLNWVLAALESHCAPIEEVDFKYSDSGEVTATVYVGSGRGLPEGFNVFLDYMQSYPRVPAFEWSLEVLPHYSHIAARAVEDSERFEQIGEHLRADLVSGAEIHIPKVRCPCAHGRAPYRGDDSCEARTHTAGVLQDLRDGWLRWRRGGAME